MKFGVLSLFYRVVSLSRGSGAGQVWSLHIQALRGGLTPNLAVVLLPLVSLGAQCPPKQ